MADTGSIPAHTGERECAGDSAGQSGVYPRTYGGTDSGIMNVMPSVGLSPHIRGNDRESGPRPHGGGSIPAHTGERHVRARPARD